MNRRNFFKGLFSAGMVAAMPKPIFDQIVAAPTEPEFKKLVKAPKKSKKTPSKNGLFLFDKETLIAWTPNFCVNYRQRINDISSLEDPKPYSTYEPGLREWSIIANTLQIPEKYYFTNKPLTAIMKYDNIEFNGNVLITEMTMEAPMEDRINCSAKFVGYGAIVYENIEPKS